MTIGGLVTRSYLSWLRLPVLESELLVPAPAPVWLLLPVWLLESLLPLLLFWPEELRPLERSLEERLPERSLARSLAPAVWADASSHCAICWACWRCCWSLGSACWANCLSCGFCASREASRNFSTALVWPATLP